MSPENLQKGRRGPDEKIELDAVSQSFSHVKKYGKSIFRFSDVLGDFWQKTDFLAVFGCKNTKIEIQLAHRVFVLESCPFSMIWH